MTWGFHVPVFGSVYACSTCAGVMLACLLAQLISARMCTGLCRIVCCSRMHGDSGLHAFPQLAPVARLDATLRVAYASCCWSTSSSYTFRMLCLLLYTLAVWKHCACSWRLASTPRMSPTALHTCWRRTSTGLSACMARRMRSSGQWFRSEVERSIM
jgi:hypothetical protein